MGFIIATMCQVSIAGFSDSFSTHEWSVDSSLFAKLGLRDDAGADDASAGHSTASILKILTPPAILLEHPPLALLSNGLIAALNELRYGPWTYSNRARIHDTIAMQSGLFVIRFHLFYRLYESALRSCSVFAPVDALQAVFSATVIEVAGILRKFTMETSLSVQKQAALASMMQVCLFIPRLATGALLRFCIVELNCLINCIFMHEPFSKKADGGRSSRPIFVQGTAACVGHWLE
jgi:hypothetical protein